MRYRSVMVAFDGSAEAELALAHACAIAQACLARVTLVGVLAPPPLLAWQTPVGSRALPRADLQERLQVAANDVPDHLRADDDCCSRATRRASSCTPCASTTCCSWARAASPTTSCARPTCP